VRIIGETADGRPLVDGVFSLYDTHGVPLDVLLGHILDRGWMIAWLDFAAEARAAGWKRRRVMVAVEHALRDAGHGALADIVLPRMEKLCPE
jgi:alanyl-tRNA synthetase